MVRTDFAVYNSGLYNPGPGPSTGVKISFRLSLLSLPPRDEAEGGNGE